MKISITREKLVKINNEVIGTISGQRFTDRGTYSGNNFHLKLKNGKSIKLDFPYYSCVRDYVKSNAIEIGLIK